MPDMYDTHVHFEHRDDGHGIEPTVQRALGAGVVSMIAVGGTAESNAAALEAAALFPRNVRAAVGLDRSAAAAGSDAAEAEFGRVAAGIRTAAAGGRLAAIGETGLDFFHEPSTAAVQRALFVRHLELAAGTGLPLVIHSRDADEATLDCLSPFRGTVRGVLHCFTGTADFARAVLDLGLHISFSGILTFRNADQLRAVAAGIPADRLLVETDSPYLAPVPLRGKRNEPAFLPHVLKTLAEARRTTVEEIAAVTAANARALFGTPV